MAQNLKNLKKLLNRNKFAGLMSLYDSNFHAFMKLMPDLHKLPVLCCSRVSDSPDLYAEVLERCKFTTIIKLTYFFELASINVEQGSDAKIDSELEELSDQGAEFIPDPDLTIRIYHDAKVVEAVSCREQGFMPIGTNDLHDAEQIECRWESNLFLQKWLQFTFEMGHKFDLQNINELQELPCVV